MKQPAAFRELVAAAVAFVRPVPLAGRRDALRDLRAACEAAADAGDDWPAGAASLRAAAVAIVAGEADRLPPNAIGIACDSWAAPPAWMRRRDIGDIGEGHEPCGRD